MAESSSKAPVIAGLAIGVGFIVGFSSLIYVSNGGVFSVYQREGTALSLSSSPSSLPVQGYIELKGDNALDTIFPRRMAAVVEKVLSDPDVSKLVLTADSALLENNFEGFDEHPDRLRIIVSGERELGGSWQTSYFLFDSSRTEIIVKLQPLDYNETTRLPSVISIESIDFRELGDKMSVRTFSENQKSIIAMAMRNDTLQKLFAGRDMIVTHVRDWGVSYGSDCPIADCAIILFDDKADNVANGFASAIVNARSGRVVDFSLHRDVIIARASDTQETRHFLLKYPDAQVDVIRDGTKSIVAYTIARQIEQEDSSFIERKRVLGVVFDKSDLLTAAVEFRLYCIDGLSTPAIGGDIVGRIDNESCFGER